MTKHSFTKTRKIAAVLLTSALFCMPLTLAGCDTEEEENKHTGTTQTDTQKISNANFEYYDTNDGKNVIITSPTGWSRSANADANGSTAASSAKLSGIVKTNKSDWDSITKSKVALTAENAEAEWENASVYDRLKFYEDEDVDSTDDFEDYVSYNADLDDLPDCENPGTHAYDASSDTEEDSSVLMIHNYRSDGLGTAQHFTSTTTLTLSANTAAKLSVWVKTSNLTFNDGTPVTKNRGAYIAVNQTLGSTAMQPLTIKNINTEGVTENNGWVQYTMYLKGHNLSDSTFTISFGLGQGGGSNKFEYVDGYAFFDDLTYESISLSEYERTAGDVPTVTSASSAEKRDFETDKAYKSETAFASSLYFTETSLKDMNVTFSPTEEKYGNVSYTSVPAEGSVVYKGLSLNTQNDLQLCRAYENIVSPAQSYWSPYLQKYIDDTKDYPFDPSTETVLLLSAGGAAYTANVTSQSFVLAPDSYALLTYYVKTSALNGYTGAAASIVDGSAKTAMASFDTTTLATVDVDSKEDLFNGWKKCAFLLSNTTDSDKTFSMNLTYGPTTIVGTTNASYLAGYAAFTNFTLDTLTEEEFGEYAAGTYVVSTSLVNGYKTVSTDGFDSMSYSDAEAIENGFGTPQNYKGVEGGSSYVGGTDYSYANSNENAGLLNRSYAENYWNNNETWMSTLLQIATAEDMSLANALRADNWWNLLFGTANQPLLIVNTVEQAYGYISTSRTISSNSYQSVSVKVKVSKGAIAYVYLMDTSSLSDGYNKPVKLKTPALSYWYDDDNNVCKSDPFADDYSERDGVVYLYNNNDSTLDANGLYMSVDKNDTKQYANLSAYEKDDEGNLITEDEEIAFFFNKADNLYYAHFDDETNAYSTPVYDFDHSYARYTEQEADCVTVIDGNDPAVAGKWVTVNYFLHTGNDTKQYRLEIFSGSRDGSVKSAADSYVLFDAVPSGTLSSSYDGLLKESIEKIKEKADPSYKEDDIRWYENAVYYTYSFHDDADYLRYDEAADTENQGDLYTGYQQSSYSEVLSYLYYEDTETDPAHYSYTTYMDFSAVDVNVTPAAADVDDTDDNTDEEEPVYNVWLLVSSIILSVVLIAVLVILLVRMIVKKVKMRKVRKANTYIVNKKQAHYKKKLKLKDE